MNNRQKTFSPTRGALGFSMIDVLVAIVVLATGLLALAALQGALTRNGADARARSQVAAFTESVLDRMRFAGYTIVAPSTAIPTGTTIAPSSSCSGALTLAQTLACDANAAQTAAGVSNLRTTITAQLYCGATGGAFTAASACASGAANYKQVKATSTWTDASGQSRSASFDTTISQVSVSPTDNSLAQQTFAPAVGYSPVVRESNPGNTMGVIPIAISANQDAAATNPKPVVSNTGTTFSTLTYVRAASAYGGNQITQRVDTKVVQCSCKFGGPVTTDPNLATILAQVYQPTYWDGTTYVTPAKSPDSRTKGVDSNTTQDSTCDVCCRDRNDGGGNTVAFDNYTGDTGKYQYVNGTLTLVTSGTYVQACRLIRVGGQYATATDSRNNFFSMLPTSNCAAETTPAPTGCTSSLTASDTVPSSSTETSYATFVKDYLYSNLTALKTNGVPTVLSTSPQTSDPMAVKYNNSPYSLNAPTNITITLPNTVTRWLYSRGIYVDHLETLARTALTNAIANCPGTLQTDIQDCALPVLPFTTINMTELTNWSSSPSSVIQITTNAPVGTDDESSPTRGGVTVVGTAGDTSNAIAKSYASNSGLTGVTINQATTLNDLNTSLNTTNALTDQKQFTLAGAAACTGSKVYFDVALTGLDWMSNVTNASLDPSVSWSGDGTQLGTAASGFSNAYLAKISGNYVATYAGDSSVLPIAACSTKTPATPVGITLNVQYFNKLATTDNSGDESVNCTATSTGTGKTQSINNKATVCYNYAVNASAIQINGSGITGATATLMSGTNDGGLREGAVITIPASPGISSTTNTIGGATAVSIPFTLTAKTVAPGTCVCTSDNCNQYTYIPGTCSN